MTPPMAYSSVMDVPLLEPFAENDEAPREGEEDADQGERYEVHVQCPRPARGSAAPKAARRRVRDGASHP